jgi:outer membrane protein OmpA-like peptidoglycan-associated protein/opacity protein-like surface antigen
MKTNRLYSHLLLSLAVLVASASWSPVAWADDDEEDDEEDVDEDEAEDEGETQDDDDDAPASKPARKKSRGFSRRSGEDTRGSARSKRLVDDDDEAEDDEGDEDEEDDENDDEDETQDGEATSEAQDAPPPIVDGVSVHKPQRFVVSAELVGATPVDKGNKALFGMGGGVGVGAELNLHPLFGVHGGIGAIFLKSDQSMSGTSWIEGHLGGRLHWGVLAFGPRTKRDGWLDAHVTYGTSDGIRRSGFDVGAGLEFALAKNLRAGPVVRYQFGSDPESNHAHLFTVGVVITVGRGPRVEIRRELADSPLPDADGDGVADEDDKCLHEPAGKHPDPDREGCPWEDEDDDGVRDHDDKCPEEAQGATPDPSKKGCPLRDRDGDGISDADDACPREAGVASEDPNRHGCRSLAKVTDTKIEILEQIHFETGSASILPDSYGLLEAVKTAIETLPEGTRLRIEGHTDERGTAAFNVDLSRRRARAVATWLGKAGLDIKRLDVQGFGKSRPVVTDTSDDARALNRRVEFIILQ